jgi:hypothetical protein
MQTVPITTNVMSSNPAQEVYSIQHYVIKFVSDLLSVFFSATIYLKILLKGVLTP